MLKSEQSQGTAIVLPEQVRREALLQRIVPFTMVARKRLEFLYDAAQEINRNATAGDIVQCGVCNGGSAAVAGHGVREGRMLHLFDSFCGLPTPSPLDGPKAESFTGLCRGNQVTAKLAMRVAGIEDSRIHIYSGWFKDTFPTAHIGRIAMLVIDADWYDSVQLTLQTFYDAVVPGGIVYIDDYGYWEGCRKATDAFLEREHLRGVLRQIDDTGHFFKKPATTHVVT